MLVGRVGPSPAPPEATPCIATSYTVQSSAGRSASWPWASSWWLPRSWSAGSAWAEKKGLWGIAGLAVWFPRVARWWQRRRPVAVEDLLADLASPWEHRRRWALQILTDRAGQPFGKVACWPFQTHTREQFENLVALYREWWTVRTRLDAGETLGDFVAAHMRVAGASAYRAGIEGDSGLGEPRWERMPPRLNPGPFVQTLQPRIEEALRQVAGVINDSPGGEVVAEAEEAIRCHLAELMWDALEAGLRLRAQCDPRLTWVPPESQDGEEPSHEDPTSGRKHFRDRLEMAVRTPWRTTFGDRMQKAVDRVADAVRDSMLDWNPDAGDEPGRSPPGPLPAVTPARLAEVMRPAVEAVLAEVARALNESAAPADLEARCEELHRLFGELLCVSLERGEDLRVDAAVGARPVPGGPHGWAEGFRRIKAEEARQTESPGQG
jgi:hypothetical protein